MLTDAEARRNAIINAVWQVIAENGMGALSMRNVAAAAEVSVGRIQYWFSSKDELLKASLEEMLSTAARLHATATEGCDDQEALWQLLWQPVTRAAASRAGVSVFYHYVAAGINHPWLAKQLAQAKDGMEDEVVKLLGRITPGHTDPRNAACTLIAAADGLTMRVLIGGLSATAAQRTLRAELDRVVSPGA